MATIDNTIAFPVPEETVITITITCMLSDKESFLDVLETAEVNGIVSEPFSTRVSLGER